MDDYWNQGKDDYSDIQGRALRERCVRYNWCANELCMRSRRTDHYNILFLLEYSSVYSHSCFITDARVCWRSLWGSVVFMCIRASDAPNNLFLQRNYLLMASWIVNNNKTLLHFFIIKLSNIKIHPTRLFNYLFNMYFIIYLHFTW